MAIKKTDKFERIEDKDERKKALSIALCHFFSLKFKEQFRMK